MAPEPPRIKGHIGSAVAVQRTSWGGCNALIQAHAGLLGSESESYAGPDAEAIDDARRV